MEPVPVVPWAPADILVNENAIGQELQQNLNKLTKWTNDWQLPISYTIFTDAVTVKLYADDVKS